MKINHNISALNAYRNLAVNNANTAKNLEKLSSGLRINRASDDAAGLAISEKMRSQIRGLDMAERNTLDGVSFIQTAEGALSSTHSILQRMRELAVQAANDSYADSDRGAIQEEINQLTNEINRIGNTTEFNTKKLLDGSLALGQVTTTAAGQAATAATITGGVADLTKDLSSINAGTSVQITIDGTNYTINNTDLKTLTGSQTATNLQSLIENADTVGNGSGTKLSTVGTVSMTGGKITITSNTTGATSNVTFTIIDGSGGTDKTNIQNAFGINDTSTATGLATATGKYLLPTAPQDMIIDGITLTFDPTGAAGWKDVTSLVTAINSDSTLGAKYTASDAGGGNILLTQKPGKESSTAPINGGSVVLQIGANQGQTVTLEIKNMRASALGLSRIDTGGPQTITLSDGKSLNVWYTTSLQSNNGTTNTSTEYTLDVSNHDKATAAITAIDDAIQRVSAERSRMGAVQNRLDYAADNLRYMNENVTASESRIRDLDMAVEMTAYTKNNILVQSAQAMLAQANQLPQGVLQLLK